MTYLHGFIRRNRYALPVFFAVCCAGLFIALSSINTFTFFSDDIQDYYLGPYRHLAQIGVSPFAFPISYKAGLGFNYLNEMQFGWWNVVHRALLTGLSQVFSSDVLFIKSLTAVYVFIFSFGVFICFSKYNDNPYIVAAMSLAMVFSSYNVNYRFQAWVGEFFTLAWFPLIYYSFYHTKGKKRLFLSVGAMYLFVSAGFLQYIVCGIFLIFIQHVVQCFFFVIPLQKKDSISVRRVLFKKNIDSILIALSTIYFLMVICYPVLAAKTYILRAIGEPARGLEFLTVTWSDLINSVLPFYLSNKTVWGGEPLGGPIFFVGMPLLMALTFLDKNRVKTLDTTVLVTTVCSILILFFPTIFGPFRWTVRFLSFSFFYLSILVLPILHTGIKNIPNRNFLYFFCFVFLAELINAPWDSLYTCLSGVIFLISLWICTKWQKPESVLVVQVFAMTATLFLFLPHKTHFHKTQIGIARPPTHEGLVLNIIRPSNMDTQYLENAIDYNGVFLTNYAAVTSYSPVRHSGLSKLLCITDVHGQISCDINKVLSTQVANQIDLIDFLGIKTVVMDRDFYPVYRSLLLSKSFSLKYDNGTTVSYTRKIPDGLRDAVEDRVQIIQLSDADYVTNGPIQINLKPNVNTVLIPVVYWPGYLLQFDGNKPYWSCEPYFDKTFVKCSGNPSSENLNAHLVFLLWKNYFKTS